MQRLNFWRRGNRPRTDPSSASQKTGPTSPQSLTVPIRDAERRRLARLQTRRSNLEYDLSRAESAFLSHNRWTERVEQLDEAIQQANDDIAQLVPQPSDIPTVRLPPTPIEITVVSIAEPAELILSISGEQLRYHEEVDWAERGHQLTLPTLVLYEGDVVPLVPPTLSPAERDLLADHLRNSFSIIANEALECATDGQELPSLTLADLTRACEQCGGWLDPKGRCPMCTRFEWQRNEIAEAAARLLDERNSTLAELDHTRERLPIIRRQIQEVDHDIAELRARGVEPE
ncbi:MAG TPA: hypothetical protein VHV31_13815 [Nitrolancea sp.]|jgi:hypothetical protein|nr:hypothetical protein [Nitrolancea sp.]